jgi:hypothetical protein
MWTTAERVGQSVCVGHESRRCDSGGSAALCQRRRRRNPRAITRGPDCECREIARRRTEEERAEAFFLCEQRRRRRNPRAITRGPDCERREIARRRTEEERAEAFFLCEQRRRRRISRAIARAITRIGGCQPPATPSGPPLTNTLQAPRRDPSPEVGSAGISPGGWPSPQRPPHLS